MKTVAPTLTVILRVPGSTGKAVGSPPLWPPLGSRLCLRDIQSGGDASAVGRSWRAAAGAAGWTRPDPTQNPARPSWARPAFGGVARSLTRHCHAGPGASSRGAPLTLHQTPPLCVRAPWRAGRPRCLCLPSQSGAARGAGAPRRRRRPEGRAPSPSPAGSLLRGSDSTARGAARTPCRAGAPLSLVCSSRPTRKPQAGQRPWGVGAARRGGVDAVRGAGPPRGCGCRTQPIGRPSGCRPPGIREANEEKGIRGRKIL